MLAHKTPRERVALACVGAFAVGLVTYIGANAAEQPAPITVTQEKPTVEVPEAKPVEKEVVVHVAGLVAKPGVYHLEPDARVDDALKAAGGAKPGADLDLWNLAAKVIDGSQIYLSAKTAPAPTPTRGRIAQAPPSRLEGSITPMAVAVPEAYRGGPDSVAAYSAPKASPRSGKAKEPPGPVSLNTATPEQLDTLPGVGLATAAKILEYRQEHGGFGSVDELLAVKGIGPKKLEAMRKWVRL